MRLGTGDRIAESIIGSVWLIPARAGVSGHGAGFRRACLIEAVVEQVVVRVQQEHEVGAFDVQAVAMHQLGQLRPELQRGRVPAIRSAS